MLILMFDLEFKSMWFVITFLSHENDDVNVVEYDQELLLVLLIKATKLKMERKGFENLFKT
jgi:hypothetical protein